MPKYVIWNLDYSSCYYEGESPEVKLTFVSASSEEEAKKHPDYFYRNLKEIPNDL